VVRAVKAAPSTTRAAVRGLCVHKFHDSVETAQWDHVTLKTSGGDLLKIDLTDLFREKALADVFGAIDRARSVDELAGLLA
jgi:Pup amidohydrolase